VSNQIVRVTARPRADGIDIDRLALALHQLAVQLPERKGKRTAKHSMKLTNDSERTVNPHEDEGVA
jgi:hypothetical protein